MRITYTLFGTGKAVVMDSELFLMKRVVGMLAHGVYGMTVIKKKYIGPSTEREMSLRHAYNTSILEMFILFVVIWMGISTRYSVWRRLAVS